ncbi:hypothetical protein FJZ22_03055, partial [Candidatus Pacearchaeota archaeon]|nr:hypothetical protein [Candidatus Pacearchaeota archaeon]
MKVMYTVFVLIVGVFLLGVVSAADPGHGANVIGSGMFESGSYAFPGNLSIAGNLSIGSSIFFVNPFLGYVGIGTATPISALDVRGHLNVSGNVTATYFIGSGAFLTGIASNSFNATYAQFAYNQTTPAQSYADSIVNRSFNQTLTDSLYASKIWNYNQSDGSYNVTYATYAYNQTLAAINNLVSQYLNLSGTNANQNLNVGIYNITAAAFIGDGRYLHNISIYNASYHALLPYGYNQSDGSYNATYAQFAYNQTAVASGAPLSANPWDNSSTSTFIRAGFPQYVNISNVIFVNGTLGTTNINNTLYVTEGGRVGIGTATPTHR